MVMNWMTSVKGVRSTLYSHPNLDNQASEPKGADVGYYVC